MTTTFTYEEALLQGHQRDSSISPQRGLFTPDRQETGENAAKKAQSSVPPKPPRSSVSQVDGTQPTIVASPARCKLLPKDGLSKDDSDEYYVPEGFTDDFELLIHQLYADDLDNLKNPVRGGEKYKIPKCLLPSDSSVEEDLSGQKEDQKKSVAKSEDEFVAMLLRLRKLMNDVQRDFESVTAGTQEVKEEVDQQQMEGALDIVKRKLHSMESGGAEYDPCSLRDRAAFDVYPVHPAQPAAWCSSSKRPSSDPAAHRFDWVHDFMDVALLGVSFYFLFKTYRILKCKSVGACSCSLVKVWGACSCSLVKVWGACSCSLVKVWELAVVV
ncbi:hypothetical protein CEXT_246381 [Caerostris extrusa]|uniref:Uncharacterized protein n=1 Tax=Caerostris extrusa TaxID=172846 RepID=A0AAV4UTQ7_CAEEX|nr:hypothetical protein CEXT_246381 [Caerostris extrusa]